MGHPKPRLNPAARAIFGPRGLLVAFVLTSTFLGFTRFNLYGESWDEQVDFQYGEDASAHYAAPSWYWDEYGNLKYYGPAYLMLAHSITSRIWPIFPAWEVTDARHFVNHLTFQIATIGLFCLCLRVMGGWPALAATLLFATQPVLFGHSFINQKDVPFMAGFILAAVLGFSLGDGARRRRGELCVLFRQEWEGAPVRWRAVLVGSGVGAALVCLELLAVKGAVLPMITRVVTDAYAGDSLPLINEWFARVAHEASRLPVEAYRLKATTLYMRFRWPIVALAATPFVGLMLYTFRLSYSAWWRSEADLIVIGLSGGVVAGLTTATRVMGLSVLALVGMVVIVRRGWSGVPALVVYTAAAGVACYAAWPYLHGAPLARLWESITVMSHYPWSGGILYGGEILQPQALPRSYIPFLLVVQLTLPAVFLGVAGILLAALQALKSKERLPEHLALAAWIGGPLVAVVLLNSTLYGNFRQLLFVTPPLFVFAGVTLEAIASRLRSRTTAAVLAILVLAPGVVGIVRLHPYEYIYYNALVGGVRGAFRSYEMDYWCVSYREAMQWINEAAPPEAVIAVAPPGQAADHFARSDLVLVSAQVPVDLNGRAPIYGLGCGRGNNDLGFFPEYSVAHEVMVQGARLSVIRDFSQPAADARD